MGTTVAQWLHHLNLELARNVGSVCLNVQTESFQAAEHQNCSVFSAGCILHC